MPPGAPRKELQIQAPLVGCERRPIRFIKKEHFSTLISEVLFEQCWCWCTRHYSRYLVTLRGCTEHCTSVELVYYESGSDDFQLFLIDMGNSREHGLDFFAASGEWQGRAIMRIGA